MNEFSIRDFCINSDTESSDSDGVLSEVHVHPGKPPKLENKFFISRYPILNPMQEETSQLNGTTLACSLNPFNSFSRRL
jgi:hypothetical protein